MSYTLNSAQGGCSVHGNELGKTLDTVTPRPFGLDFAQHLDIECEHSPATVITGLYPRAPEPLQETSQVQHVTHSSICIFRLGYSHLNPSATLSHSSNHSHAQTCIPSSVFRPVHLPSLHTSSIHIILMARQYTSISPTDPVLASSGTSPILSNLVHTTVEDSHLLSA